MGRRKVVTPPGLHLAIVFYVHPFHLPIRPLPIDPQQKYKNISFARPVYTQPFVALTKELESAPFLSPMSLFVAVAIVVDVVVDVAVVDGVVPHAVSIAFCAAVRHVADGIFELPLNMSMRTEVVCLLFLFEGACRQKDAAEGYI